MWKGKDKYSILQIGKDVVFVMWLGAVKIYNSIRSCFGTGRWIQNKPWTSKDIWRNN
jgi:hypothetical protein